MKKKKKLMLIILDGWGHGANPEADAIAQANTPFISSLYDLYPNAELKTDGEVVGLPQGQMGNSEVGHMNIGAGRIVYQDLLKINNSIKEGSFEKNPLLIKALQYSNSLHLIGLVSDGGVHSSMDHLFELCNIIRKKKLKNVFIHAFTDGRDTNPKGGITYIKKLQKHIENSNIKLASIIGRYYAMDRDKRWERIELAYNLLVHGKGEYFHNAEEAIMASYNSNITDEFIKPIIFTGNNFQEARIKNGDSVICFNYRPDRMRQITQVLTQENIKEYGMNKLKLQYTAMTEYDSNFKNVDILFEDKNIGNTLGEIISKNGLKQIRIAESEKYPHVTYFFSGGKEEPFDNERRILCPSPKVNTYDLQPEMNAEDVMNAIIPEIEKASADFICLNFANPDMVGHTGVFDAVIKAVEKVDSCTEKIVLAGLKQDYSFVIIADHGNADYMINEDGSPNTAHTKNPVPIFVIDNNFNGIVKNGKLADVAPTILKLMNIAIPEEMTGEVLIQ